VARMSKAICGSQLSLSIAHIAIPDIATLIRATLARAGSGKTANSAARRNGMRSPRSDVAFIIGLPNDSADARKPVQCKRVLVPAFVCQQQSSPTPLPQIWLGPG